MKIFEVEQGTKEWFEARAGIPSASNFDKLVTPTGKLSKQVETYAYQLAGERMCGTSDDGSYKSFYMERGNQLEEEARNLYDYIREPVQKVGFCVADDDSCGCSPDGLMKNGGLEIKCPKLSTHVKYLCEDKCPPEYYLQVQGSLYVTGLEWWDFMSYYPLMKPFVKRVFPDREIHKKLKEAIKNLNVSVSEILKKVKI